MLILLLDDINIKNYLHVRFFRNSSYFFIGLLIIIFKHRKLNNTINVKKSYPNKVKRLRKNKNEFLSNKKIFHLSMKKKNSQHFIKILKEIKCLLFFKRIQKIN